MSKDSLILLLVALLTIFVSMGTVFFWGLTRHASDFRDRKETVVYMGVCLAFVAVGISMGMLLTAQGC